MYLAKVKPVIEIRADISTKRAIWVFPMDFTQRNEVLRFQSTLLICATEVQKQ